jgi:hypothetical protein
VCPQSDRLVWPKREREKAGADGTQKVISDSRCETFEVHQELCSFQVAHFLVREEFPHALFA